MPLEYQGATCTTAASADSKESLSARHPEEPPSEYLRERHPEIL